MVYNSIQYPNLLDLTTIVHQTHLQPVFLAFKLYSLHCLLACMCMGTCVPLKPYLFTPTIRTSSFHILWMCVVTLNMALKPYFKFCSCKRVVIKLQFGRQGPLDDIETCLYGLQFNSIPYILGLENYGTSKTPKHVFLTLKLSSLHCLLDCMWMGIYVPLKPYLFIPSKSTSSFFFPWMCVTLNMDMKFYLKLCSFRRVEIQVQFGS